MLQFGRSPFRSQLWATLGLYRDCFTFYNTNRGSLSFYSLQKYYLNKDVYFWHTFNLLLIFVNLRYEKNYTNSDCNEHNKACNIGSTTDSNITFMTASSPLPALSFPEVYFIRIIPLACAECDDSLPFSGASSIPLCYVILPATLLHQLFFHPRSPHIPSISWSTFQSCCSQIHIQYPFGNSTFFHSLYMPKPT